jgi:hypothetical protein
VQLPSELRPRGWRRLCSVCFPRFPSQVRLPPRIHLPGRIRFPTQAGFPPQTRNSRQNLLAFVSAAGFTRTTGSSRRAQQRSASSGIPPPSEPAATEEATPTNIRFTKPCPSVRLSQPDSIPVSVNQTTILTPIGYKTNRIQRINQFFWLVYRRRASPVIRRAAKRLPCLPGAKLPGAASSG